ncbi:MAG TPA: RNA polymerase sigma factor [Actinophytocola sp.]|uniref:RNA polymerase sigma factor n=1 Tax=Actinophytocola sp. TaxID=1872138 RepID=UPI002DDD8BF2|nr:RNA polymerase sigma factor [Actinophytocola sp.]HEV2779016.1 RNA polymerase sigma factor [Actinophytocola sp.]
MEYQKFFLEEYTKVVAFLRKLGFGLDQAEDAAQDAMFAALGHWPLPKDRRRGWIRTAARRVAIREAEKARSERPRLVAKGYGIGTRDGTEFQQLVDHRDELSRLLSRLAHVEREVLVWSLDGFKAREIAAEMGLKSAGVVRVYLSRAKKKIARLLENGYLDQGETQ